MTGHEDQVRLGRWFPEKHGWCSFADDDNSGDDATAWPTARRLSGGRGPLSFGSAETTGTESMRLLVLPHPCLLSFSFFRSIFPVHMSL